MLRKRGHKTCKFLICNSWEIPLSSPISSVGWCVKLPLRNKGLHRLKDVEWAQEGFLKSDINMGNIFTADLFFKTAFSMMSLALMRSELRDNAGTPIIPSNGANSAGWNCFLSPPPSAPWCRVRSPFSFDSICVK